ncbi:hypothetical protein LINPERPRIM_LOCUS32608 [Linum perenne]
MAIISLYPEQTTKPKPKTPLSTTSTTKSNITHKHNKKHPTPKHQKHHQPPSSSWVDQFKNLLTCKQIDPAAVHLPTKPIHPPPSSTSKMGSSSCSSICSFKDVVHGNTRVVHRSDNSSPETSSLGQDARLLNRKSLRSSSHTTPSLGRGIQFRKLSSCYECHSVLDPCSRFPSPRSTICACSLCGDIFPKMESLELHQRVRHAVSELGPEDSGRNIVEIIFKSSWMKKDSSICKIERILKVHNTQRTIQRFEDCRDAVKSRALSSTRKNPRCAADGNELLRFYCTTLTCSLGARGGSSICAAVPGCGVCTAIRHGFQGKELRGVRTTASSGRAHDSLVGCGGVERRAMLVCRVIAGRVKRGSAAGDDQSQEDGGGGYGGGAYDSVAGCEGVYSNYLEELFVYNPKAILPCFVVIYKAVES